MELKVGMYVRTKYNDFCNMVAIRKIDEIDDDGGFWIDDYIIDTYGDEQNKLHEEDIEIASENIIDVLKVGDYVNGEMITFISSNPQKNQNGKPRIILNETHSLFGKYEGIKSIVTKEQFALMEYEVE